MTRPQEGPSRLLSAQVKLRDGGCEKCEGDGERGFACGLDGDIICRVQSRIRAERCRCPG